MPFDYSAHMRRVNAKLSREHRVRAGKRGGHANRGKHSVPVHKLTAEDRTKGLKRKIQLEQATVDYLKAQGWTVFFPTAVCDRIIARNGEVFFAEFKPEVNQELRPQQRQLQALIPERYMIVLYPDYL